LSEDGTIGERAICVANELLEALSYADIKEEDLYKIIEGPHRVNKI